jgi:hypothetical protein
MEKHGFLPCYPLVCVRAGPNKLKVKGGQHRLLFAEELGLVVYYTEVVDNFNVAEIAGTVINWKLRDFAEMHAFNGRTPYQEGLRFADENGIPISTAFGLLRGHAKFQGLKADFVSGKFVISDRDWAEKVVSIYRMMLNLAPATKSARFLEACTAVCRVEGFVPARLLRNAAKCREKLLAYSTRDAYLDMIEAVYNFGQKQLVGIKIKALMALRERNPVGKKQAKNVESESRC